LIENHRFNLPHL